MNNFELPCLEDRAGAPFPDTTEALDSPNGLLAWGGDLQPNRVLRAYRSGIFPWYSEGQPLLWWSPAPRCVIFPEKVHISRRTRRRYNSGKFSLSLDSAFAEVIAACAAPRGEDNGTWITREMLEAYIQLHRLGHAHSLEVWEEGELVGGIYGLAMGSIFFGESMFSHKTDASKIALITLCRQLHQWGVELLDCQVGNPHLFSMGAEQISRTTFERLLRELTSQTGTEQNWRGPVSFEPRW